MKTTVGDIVNSTNALGRLLEQPMKAKASYRLAKAAKHIQHTLDAFNDTRSKLVEKYADKDGEIKPDAKNFDKWVDELQGVLDEKLDIEIKQVTLASISQAEISGSDMMALDWLIKD